MIIFLKRSILKKHILNHRSAFIKKRLRYINFEMINQRPIQVDIWFVRAF